MRNTSSLITSITALFSALVFIFVFPFFASAYEPTALTEEEIGLIAALCYYETEDEPLLAKVCFCAMILNRLKDDRFPSDVRRVVFGGSFESAENGRLSNLPTDSDMKTELFALRQVIRKNLDPTCGALFTMKSSDPSLWEIMVLFTVGDRVFGVIT